MSHQRTSNPKGTWVINEECLLLVMAKQRGLNQVLEPRPWTALAILLCGASLFVPKVGVPIRNAFGCHDQKWMTVMMREANEIEMAEYLILEVSKWLRRRSSYQAWDLLWFIDSCTEMHSDICWDGSHIMHVAFVASRESDLFSARNAGVGKQKKAFAEVLSLVAGSLSANISLMQCFSELPGMPAESFRRGWEKN